MVNKKVTSAPARPPAAPQRKAVEKATEAVKPKATTAAPRATTEVASRFANVQRVFRETVAELKKVQWPDRTTTRNLTLVVIGMSAALAALLGSVDALLTRLIEWLVGLG